MDHRKIKILLTKIQTLLDDSHTQEYSRLERDLVKSYILQLYDAVLPASELEEPDLARKVVVEIPKPEPVFEQPKPEPIRIADPAPMPEPEPVRVQPVFDVPLQEMHSPKPAPPKVEEPLQPAPEPVVNPTYQSFSNPTREAAGDELRKVFEIAGHAESRISHAPIGDIGAALGLNERIFTLKELFGGDQQLFDSTCARLNDLHSFSEAREMLIGGVAQEYHWSDKSRIKMAEEFIRIVRRKYPPEN